MEADQVFHADVSRGTELADPIEIEVGGHRDEITGAELRAALLSTSHTNPSVLGPVGAGRYALQLDPDGRSSTIAHLDAQGLSKPKYWLYRRGEEAPVHLTRWMRAGYTSRVGLLEQVGINTDSKSESALEKYLTEVVARGLPPTLDLEELRSNTSDTKVEAPTPGWLDVPPGALKVDTERIPIHSVDDLGEWPGEVS